jgi:hypothetical protein
MSFRGASKTGSAHSADGFYREGKPRPFCAGQHARSAESFSSSLQGRDACVTRVAERATPEHERWRQPARNYERGSNKHAFPAKRPPKRYFLIAAVPWGTCTRKSQAGRPPRRGSPSAPHAKFAPCLSVTPPAPSAPHQKPPVAPRNTGRPEDAASMRHQSTRVLQAARSCGHPKSYRLANLRITISAKSCAISCLRIISS